MSEEILYIDDGELVYYISENEFITCDEIPMPMLEGIKHLQQKVEQKDKEIERLNNIINELEKDLNEAYDELHRGELVNGRELINNIYQELKELKENNK